MDPGTQPGGDRKGEPPPGRAGTARTEGSAPTRRSLRNDRKVTPASQVSQLPATVSGPMGGGTNLHPIAPESFLDPATEEGAGSRRKASDYSGLGWADDPVRWWEALALVGGPGAGRYGPERGVSLAAAAVPLLAILPLAVYGYNEVIVAIGGNAAFGVLLGSPCSGRVRACPSGPIPARSARPSWSRGALRWWSWESYARGPSLVAWSRATRPTGRLATRSHSSRQRNSRVAASANARAMAPTTSTSK